ncbi:MAG: hypothetical protein Q8M07_09170 [Prosthecobacter sp.]|nr:hypothetical protein [Prosthecobacter sp.]
MKAKSSAVNRTAEPHFPTRFHARRFHATDSRSHVIVNCDATCFGKCVRQLNEAKR